MSAITCEWGLEKQQDTNGAGAQNSLEDLKQASVLLSKNGEEKTPTKNWTKNSSVCFLLFVRWCTLCQLCSIYCKLFFCFLWHLQKCGLKFLTVSSHAHVRIQPRQSLTLRFVEVCSLFFLLRAALCILVAIVFQKLLFSPIWIC